MNLFVNEYERDLIRSCLQTRKNYLDNLIKHNQDANQKESLLHESRIVVLLLDRMKLEA